MDKTQNENRPAAARANEPADAPTLPPAGGGPPEAVPSQATQGVPAAASAPDPALAFLAPPQAPDEIGRLGPYRVLKVLGQGGMGVVFQAEDVRLQRLVALKAMLPALAQRPEAKERFLREARAAAALEHDHIVAIHQVDEDRGVPYIAMPFLKGLSLEDFLQQKAARNTPLKLAEICKIGREMARGLAAAHEHGLIHRDIKPANVWLDASAGGRVKILDFGLARLSQQGDAKNLTQDGAILGTPAYMAPEQARGEMVEARTDLFSLGVVLYRLCTGTLPFRGPDVISTLMAVATTQPPPPQTRRADLPQELSELVMHLLAKEPSQRPASARDVVKAIQSIEKACLGSQSATAAAPAAAGAQPVVSGERQDTIALEKPSGPGGEQRQPSGLQRSFRLWLLGGAAAVVAVVVGIVLLWPPWQTTGGGKETKEPPPLATLSPLALVSRPPKIPGIESWTIEPRGHRGSGDLVVAFSGDGKQFATGGDDGTVRLWEPANGQLLRVLMGHGQKVTALAFAPDGKTLASGSTDTTVRLWEPGAGKPLPTLPGHTGPITALAWSADGKTLASGSADKLVLLWDPVAREERRRFDHHQAGVVAVAWQSDRTLASADGNNTVWLWEAGTGKPLQSHKVKRPYCWSANRKVLAYKSGDKEVTLWDPAGDRTRALTFKEINGSLDCLDISPDGKILATGGGGGGVHCWDVDSGKLLISYRSGSTSSPGNLYFSPNGKILLERLWGGGAGGFIWPVAPLPRNEAVKRVFWGGAYVRAGGVKWSPDGKTFVAPTLRTSPAGTEFEGLLFFDPSGKDLKDWHGIAPNARGGGDVAWSPDGKLLAVGDPYKKVRIQEADSGKVLHLADEEKRELPTDSRSHLDWSPDGNTLAIYQGNLPEKRVRLFDARTGARLKNGWSGPPMRGVAWSPDNKTLATSDENATYLYDAGSGKHIGKIPVRSRRDTGLAWSPDSQVLATGGASVKLWKANSGAALPTVFAAPGTNVQAVAWSPDGKTLAAGDAAGAIRLHDAQTGALRQTCQGHEGPIHTLAWMPDSETFLSLGEKDGTVCSWKVGVETPARVLNGLPGKARFSPDRKFLAARDDRRGVQIWEMDKSRLRGTLLSVRSDGWQPPDRYLAVSADGHYRISGDAERLLVYVVQTATGQDVLTPEEFERKYGWKNDPDKVRLTSPE